MLFIILLLTFTIIASLFLLKKKRPVNSPPLVSLGLPVIGNFIEFGKNPVDFMKQALDKYGYVYTVPMLHQNLTFLFGPEASAPFFKLNDDKMSQSEVYKFMTPVFGEGIVYDAEPKKRLQQMKAMAQGLQSARLKSYVSKIELETKSYLKEKWGKKGEINLLDTLSELTILTSSRCLHGDDVRENLFAEVAKTYHDLDKGVTALSFFFPYAPIPAHKKRDNARKEMVKIFSKIIKSRREAGIKADEVNRTDILQIYIDFLYKDENTGLTDEQIVGLLIALLFAGQHTSSISSTWTAMALLHNPDCLKKFLAEQESVLLTGDNKEKNISEVPLDFDSVNNMEYSMNCVREALRMYPPLIMLMRMALEDCEVELNGNTYIIPKGDIVVTSPQVSSRLPEVFREPEKYDPERFNDERGEHKVPYAYLGFGAGRHACLGQQFGLLQVKIILSIIFRNFKLEAVSKDFPEPDYTAMVVGPKNHLQVRYEVLEKNSIF